MTARNLLDERVLINMPTQSASAKAAGEDEREWSEAYLFTAQITDDVNGLIGGVLGLASTIVEYPPTTVGEDGTEAAAPRTELRALTPCGDEPLCA